MATVDNKRIAKNTLMLYVRMIVIMGVSLYSFRLLLKELGEQDYGVYNVVGGVVVLFSFLSSALNQSTQRYLSFHLARKDPDMLRRVFSMSVNVHLLIVGIVVALGETIGLWFVNTQMNFPQGSMAAVNWLYQFSLLTFSIQILTIPFQAAIIAYERMSFFAYFSIIDAVLRLSAVMVLLLFSSGKLIVYGAALTAVSALVWVCYYAYCTRRLDACAYRRVSDRKLFKELTSFSGWNILGGIGSVGATQGVNIIFNIFCGVILNAAMGVANQVSAAVNSFSANLQAAFSPQIVKTYSAGDTENFNSLIFRSTRIAFLLNFMLGFPMILCCPTIFDLWLTQTPPYAVAFTRLILVFCMIDAMSSPLWTAAQASGKIKTYMIIISLMIFSNVPAALVLLYLDCSPVWVMGYKVGMNFCIHLTRLFYLRHSIGFPAMTYMRRAMLPAAVLVIASLPLPLLASQHIEGTAGNIGLFFASAALVGLLGFAIMLTRSERAFILEKIGTKLHFCKQNG